MNEIVEKLRKLHLSVAKLKGEFDLFALFLREDAPDVWDLVVAGRWIEADPQAALKYLSKRVQKALGPDITRLSRVVIIGPDSPALAAVTSAMAVQGGGAVEVRDSVLFGLAIRHGLIMASVSSSRCSASRARSVWAARSCACFEWRPATGTSPTSSPARIGWKTTTVRPRDRRRSCASSPRVIETAPAPRASPR